MISTSSSTREAYNPNNGEGARSVFWYVDLELVDEKAYDGLTVLAQGDSEISRPDQVLDRDRNGSVLASFERNGFTLDGSAIVPPKATDMEYAQVGLVLPEISGDDGMFTTSQLITVEMGARLTTLGLTLDWGERPPEYYRVNWYRVGPSQTEWLAEYLVTDNTQTKNIIYQTVEDFDYVEIEIHATSTPNNRVRLVEFTPGAIIRIDQDNGDMLMVQRQLDPLSEKVVIDNIKVRADNFAQDFNITDPTNIYQYFNDKMLMRPFIAALEEQGGMDYLPIGAYYLKAPSLKGNLTVLELTGENKLGVLSNTTFHKGQYMENTPISTFVRDIAADIGESISFPLWFWDVPITGYIGTMSHAQALRMIAQATGTVLMTPYWGGSVQFVELGNTPLQTIGQTDYSMENGFSPSDEDIVNTVTIETSNLRLGESEKLISIDGITGDFIDEEYYVDNAILTLTTGVYHISYPPCFSPLASTTSTPGKLEVYGLPIVNDIEIVTKSIRKPDEKLSQVDIQGNVLIQPALIDRIADRILRLKAEKRRKIKVQYRGYPYLEQGDCIDFNTGDSNTGAYCITSTTLNLEGGMTGTMEAKEL